jgi:hypothetical protein
VSLCVCSCSPINRPIKSTVVSPHHPRRRALYLVWLALVIFAGLASRSKMLAFPPFFAKYAGDALWAMMVFVGIAVVLRRRSTLAVMACAAALSCTVECSQLYHAPWIDSVRRTTIRHLVLGDTFAWGDIAAYFVGIAIGGAMERVFLKRR